MEVLSQGRVMQSSAAAAAVAHSQHRSSSCSRPVVRASLQLKPRLGASVSSRNWNALSAKVPVVSRRGKASRGVAVMSVEEPYADALVTLAKSKNLLQEIYDDVQKLTKYAVSTRIVKFFKNPTVDNDKKKEVVKSIVKQEKLQVYTQNFLFLLVDKKRWGAAKAIFEAYENKYYKVTDTEVALVTSAVTLDDDQLGKIAKKVQELTKAKNVKIKNVIDPSVIAGFKVKYGNRGSQTLDLTVKSQIDKISAQLLETDFAI